MYEEEDFEDEEASVELIEESEEQDPPAAAHAPPVEEDELEAFLAAAEPGDEAVQQQAADDADEPAAAAIAAAVADDDDDVSQHSSSHSRLASEELSDAAAPEAAPAAEEGEQEEEREEELDDPPPPPPAILQHLPAAAPAATSSSAHTSMRSSDGGGGALMASSAGASSACADDDGCEKQQHHHEAATPHSSSLPDSDSPPAGRDRVSTGSGSDSASPAPCNKKGRPASASPAVRRSEASAEPVLLTQQYYGSSPSSSGGASQARGHNHQQQQQQHVVPAASWTVNDVCDWVDGLGLCQYRKKFMHHVVDGRLLLRLSDALLRTELGIGPLGHRVLIQDGVQAVAAADLQQAASAALAGVSPEDFQAACGGGCSPSSAAAVLVAGLIALKAGQRSSAHAAGPLGARSSPGGQQLARAGSGSSSFAASPTAGPSAAAAADGSPGVRRARPFSAPCKGRSPPGRGCSASPADGRGSPSPGALGPAAGRISVYEQRAKILFELGRAQARAATTAGTASEVAGVAQLAQKEVAALQGQLADLDRKNKLAVQHATGSVDTKGIIPWKHTGSGTKAADPHPERIARPWDPPCVELTFSPKISARSRQLMSEARGAGEGAGGGGFLDRLDNDMRRREAKQKELEKRYYSSSDAGGDAARAAGKAAAADLALLSGFFAQHGWAALTVPTAGAKLTEADYRELDSQLDEVVEAYSEELGLGKSDSRQCSAVLSVRGPKKLAALVAAVRTQQFLTRYHADLSTRGSRLQQLQDSFFQHQAQPVSTGGRRAVVPLTPEQRDLASAVKWFKSMGWQEAAETGDCDDLLSALVQRARHYKTEAEKLHEKERAAAAASGPAAAAAHAAAASLPHPTINWAAAAWSVDGLGALMQTVLDARKAAAEAAAAQTAAKAKPSAVDAALGKGAAADGKPAPDGSDSAGGASMPAAATLEAAAASGADTLQLSVRLLAGMRWAGLDQLDAAKGRAKKLAVYRTLRTQQFLAFTAADLSAREAKNKALLQEFEDSRRGKLVSKAELDDFYERLQADGQRRLAELEKARADKAEREAKALALVSIKPGFSRRPRSART